ncbi:AMIN-like domain-containing (lipo)protein [Nesterenkonia natronophila]|uniref:AMIN-like domain-containing (lipo)protein n=1 Tax=Nesterenkonia natronophila TaxID=2174932 RepID=UPI0011C3FE7F|nr:hypothetical protein [Nesterenkonia natronophila]
MDDAPQRTVPPAAFAAALAACLLAAGCTGDGAEEPPDAQEAAATVEQPPLDEPTGEPLPTTAEDQAATVEGEEEELPEASASETPEENAEQGSDSEQDVLDVTEFSAEPLQSYGFPDLLTEVPEDSHLLLQEVRVGIHEGYHRIVFDHAGAGAPGWSAEYVGEAVEPGSGFPIEMTSDALLYIGVVGLEPGNAGEEQGQLEVADWIDSQGTVFSEVVTTFVHHGTASYYVGLDTEREYRVSVWEHTDGPRLIIDVLV